LLEQILGPLIGAPQTEIQTVDQIRATRGNQENSADTVPPEVATPIVHGVLDQAYRAALDEPVGMLGDISPRAAVQTLSGRDKVADWLKYLENQSATGDDPGNPMATYDFGWMWRELGSSACGDNGRRSLSDKGLKSERSATPSTMAPTGWAPYSAPAPSSASTAHGTATRPAATR
jgi:hypothetical protein